MCAKTAHPGTPQRPAARNPLQTRCPKRAPVTNPQALCATYNATRPLPQKRRRCAAEPNGHRPACGRIWYTHLTILHTTGAPRATGPPGPPKACKDKTCSRPSPLALLYHITAQSSLPGWSASTQSKPTNTSPHASPTSTPCGHCGTTGRANKPTSGSRAPGEEGMKDGWSAARR